MGEQEDISLPKATVQKIISEVLESDLTFSKEAREIIIESGIEFIMILSSMASEMADKEAKKTIAPDHVIKALEELEYHEFIPYLEQILVEHKETQRIKERRDAKFKKSGSPRRSCYGSRRSCFASPGTGSSKPRPRPATARRARKASRPRQTPLVPSPSRPRNCNVMYIVFDFRDPVQNETVM